jgi:hypothetical protein
MINELVDWNCLEIGMEMCDGHSPRKVPDCYLLLSDRCMCTHTFWYEGWSMLIISGTPVENSVA